MEKLIALTISGTPIQGAGGAPTGGKIALEKIIQLGVAYLYLAVVFLALFYLIWGGINWIMSVGDKQKLAQAREKVTLALIGLVIAFAAFIIINLISTLFGVNLITFPAIYPVDTPRGQ